MKKVLFTVLLVVLGMVGYGQMLGKIKASQMINYKTINVVLDVTYNEQSNLLYLEVDGSKDDVYICLDYSAKIKVMSYILKCKEWCHKCDSAKLYNTSKELGNIITSAGFTHFDNTYICDNVPVQFQLDTFWDKNKSVDCNLSLFVPELFADDNKYINVESKMVFIDKTELDNFYKILDTGIIRYKEKKKNDSIFLIENKKKVDDILK